MVSLTEDSANWREVSVQRALGGNVSFQLATGRLISQIPAIDDVNRFESSQSTITNSLRKNSCARANFKEHAKVGCAKVSNTLQ